MQSTIYSLKIFVILVSLLSAGIINAETLTEGNILISHRGYIYEYTRNGTLTQTFQVAKSPSTYSYEQARDIYASSPADIYVYNGTFDPYVSMLKVDTEEWSHMSYDGWYTYNNLTYGGIAASEGYVFVTSMGTNRGVIRFDTSTGDSVRFSETTQATDLNLGLDGILYILDSHGSTGGKTVISYDPVTLEELNRVSLIPVVGYSSGVRSLAVDENGNIYLADFTENIYKLDGNGNLISSLNIQNHVADNVYIRNFDIDVSEDGAVIVGSDRGYITITNTEFSSVSNFTGPSHYASGSFVNFVPYTIIPPVLTIAEPLNSDGCIEATGHDGAYVVISSENRNSDTMLYDWLATDGSTGNSDTLSLQVGVDQTVNVTLTFTDPSTDKTNSSSLFICVSDTVAPEIQILSPEYGDTVVGNNSKLGVTIFDMVDKNIKEYDVTVGSEFSVPYSESKKNQNVKLFKPTKDGKEVSITVKARDYSGNEGKDVTTIIQKHDNRK